MYWDQRGAGRSYHLFRPPRGLAIDQFVRDLDALVSIVKRRFKVQRVALLGHSWGTVIGALYAFRYPENVSVYVGIGQVGDEPEDELVGYEWALGQAENRGNRRAIAQLEQVGKPPHTKTGLRVERSWVDSFGGSYYGNKMHQGDLIWAALHTTEMSWVDLVRFGFGIHYSMEHIWPEFQRVRLEDCCHDFKVLILFLEGRHDWQVPAVVAARYFDKIHAPAKNLVWFDDSAHNLPFEQPKRFEQVMIDDVRPLAQRWSDRNASGNRRNTEARLQK